jgi:pilus assembly protein CpaE
MERTARLVPTSAKSVWIVCPHAGMMAELIPILSTRLPEVSLVPSKAYLEAPAIREQFSAEKPAVCFLDVETDPERALAVAAEILALQPGLPIVILLERNDPTLVLRFLRRGAAEFLLRPFSPEEFKAVLERLAPVAPLPRFGKGGRVICVAPAKGACGASTIAANLAAHAAQSNEGRVLLADLDPLTGVIAFLIKVKSPYSFLDALSRATSLDEDLWRGIISSRAGLDVLPAPDNPTDAMAELPDPAPLIEFARQRYDLVVVDSPPPFSRWATELASLCDELVLVTTNELAAVHAAQRALAHLERRRIERSKVRLVLSRFVRAVGLSREAIATALHIEVAHLVPAEPETIHRSIVEAKPAPASSAVGRSLRELAEQLSGRPVRRAPRPRSAWSGILSSLFSKATL